jgi:hypothetical protein
LFAFELIATIVPAFIVGKAEMPGQTIKDVSVDIDDIAGIPRVRPAGAFIRGKVRIHFADERDLQTNITLEVFGRYDPSANLESLKQSILEEARAVIDQASRLLAKPAA